MLDLRPAHKALEHFHHGFIDDSAHTVGRERFLAFDRKAYDKQQLAWGSAAWQMRALDEYRSQVSFSVLLADLATLGFSFDVIGTATRIVRDEARHVEICRRLVKTLGGSDVMEGDPQFVFPPDSFTPIQRVLFRVAGTLCIGETLSVRLISAGRKSTVDPLAHAVMSCLAADESIHSRFGWVMLEMLWPQTSKADRQLILSLLPGWLKGTEKQIVAPAYMRMEREEPVTCAPVSPFGGIGDRERACVFYDAMENEVIPRFEALGIKAKKAFR
ncbi:MAG: diiron oxygenase [Deltaproteobacteria bacterium]|nr:diiron oxygenase [Deltaproteobacteria bacterium]